MPSLIIWTVDCCATAGSGVVIMEVVAITIAAIIAVAYDLVSILVLAP